MTETDRLTRCPWCGGQITTLTMHDGQPARVCASRSCKLWRISDAQHLDPPPKPAHRRRYWYGRNR